MKFYKISLLISVLMLTSSVTSFPIPSNNKASALEEAEQSYDEGEDHDHEDEDGLRMKRFPSARMMFDVPDPDDLYEDNLFTPEKRALNSKKSVSEESDDEEDEKEDDLLKRNPSARMMFDVPDPDDLYEDNPFTPEKRALNSKKSVSEESDDDEEDLLKRNPSARMMFDVPDPDDLYEDNPFTPEKRALNSKKSVSKESDDDEEDEEEDDLLKRNPSARMMFDVPDPDDLYEDNPFTPEKRALNSKKSVSKESDDDEEDEEEDDLLKRNPSARMMFDVPDPDDLYEDNPFTPEKRALNSKKSVSEESDEDEEDDLLKRNPSARMMFDVPDPDDLYEDNPFSAKKRDRILGGNIKLSNIGQNHVMENVDFQDINEENDNDE